MISGIITSYKEPHTICKAIFHMIQAFRLAIVNYEILILCGDNETFTEAKLYKRDNIRIIRDEGLGKPSALNLAFKEAKGDILILSDGDTFISKYAIRELLKQMEDPKVGAVSGRPRSINPKDNMLGFWSHLLTDTANKIRLEKENFIVSGYLYALRSNIVKEIPPITLSDDAFISYVLLEKGYNIGYASGANVMVKFPNTFEDWLSQKKRSTGGFTQLSSEFKMNVPKNTRSFRQEAKGLLRVVAYGKSIKELWWIKLLIGARIWMWLNIIWERKIMKKDFNKTWIRIGSTK